MATVVLVTGGTGLVGKAIQHIINTEPEGSRFGRKRNETWIFASTSEADLRCDLFCSQRPFVVVTRDVGILNRRASCMKSTNLLMSFIWLPSVCIILISVSLRTDLYIDQWVVCSKT
jgi:hypothetical protein